MSTTVRNAETSALDAILAKDRAGFARLAAPSFKYGLQIFFPAAGVALPSALAPVTPSPTVTAPADIEVRTIAEALADERYEPAVREVLSREHEDNVDAWTAASAGDGIVIRIPKDVALSAPIRIDTVIAEALRADRVIVIAEEGSRATVVEHLSSAMTMGDSAAADEPASESDGSPVRAARDRSAKLHGSLLDLIVLPGASVTHVSVRDVADGVTSFERKRATVYRDATIRWFDCSFGGTYGRARVATDLAGEGASVEVTTLTFGTDDGRHDALHAVRHLASHTTSHMHARIALSGRAKAVARSLATVLPGTTHCSATQKEETLLLGKDVEVAAMPDLEIGSGAVRAGHAASAGRPDREKLFYLMSRGLSESEAVKMVLAGFFAPVIAQLRASGVEEMVQCLVDDRVDSTTPVTA